MSMFSMAKTIFKNLVKRPSTVLYPAAQKPSWERERGQVNVDINACIFCTLCDKKCPVGAIAVDKGGKSWSIDRLKCIQCNYCVEVCPKSCLTMDTARPAAFTSKQGESVCTSTL